MSDDAAPMNTEQTATVSAEEYQQLKNELDAQKSWVASYQSKEASRMAGYIPGAQTLLQRVICEVRNAVRDSAGLLDHVRQLRRLRVQKAPAQQAIARVVLCSGARPCWEVIVITKHGFHAELVSS